MIHMLVMNLTLFKIKTKSRINIHHIDQLRFFFPIKQKNPAHIFLCIQIDASLAVISLDKQKIPVFRRFNNTYVWPVFF